MGYSDDFGFYNFARLVSGVPVVLNTMEFLFERPAANRVRLTATNNGAYSSQAQIFLAPVN